LRKIALLALGFIAFASHCHAEPRWCTVTGFADRESPVYPPIAKAANVQGAVIAHIIYPTTGKVENVEIVFGSPMLVKAVSYALMKWKVKTDATGDSLCQTLVIVDFKIEGPGNSATNPPSLPPPGAYRLTVTALRSPFVTEQANDVHRVDPLDANFGINTRSAIR